MRSCWWRWAICRQDLQDSQDEQDRSIMKKLVAVCSLLFLVSFTSTAQSQQSSLDDQVKPIVASFKGKVSLFAKNLDTGETYALNPDESVRTASTIKIAVMIEA